jgi:sugar-specific transcriptional regulator TrmB
LESLAKKGLVSETTVGKKTQYQAEPPERLKTFVERQKILLEEREQRLDDIIPQIKNLQRESGERPVVKFFDGKDGIISALEELFSQAEERGGVSHIIYPKDKLEGLFTDEEREKYRKMRISRGIKSKVLYTSTRGDRQSDQTGDRIKIDETKYPISCDISIYRDKVRIAILGKKLSSIFIRSQDFADTLRSIIDLAYDNIKKPQ